MFPVDPQAPPVWTVQPLPGINCSSGKYTLRLSVEDTLGGLYHDTQWLWVDNKAIHGELNGVEVIFPDKPPDVLPPCATLQLSTLPNAGDDQEWPLGVLGIAFDEYILEGDFSNPSDNFGGFSVGMAKQGGPSLALPVPGPGSPTTVGTSRVGEPGTRCATASPPPPVGPKAPGVLTVFDARQLDATLRPAGNARQLPPPARHLLCLLLHNGRVGRVDLPEPSGGRHEDSDIWPICICNDLPVT